MQGGSPLSQNMFNLVSTQNLNLDDAAQKQAEPESADASKPHASITVLKNGLNREAAGDNSYIIHDSNMIFNYEYSMEDSKRQENRAVQGQAVNAGAQEADSPLEAEEAAGKSEMRQRLQVPEEASEAQTAGGLGPASEQVQA